MGMLSFIFGNRNDRTVAALKPLLAQINAQDEKVKNLSDSQLLALTDNFKHRLLKGETLNDILPEAFAAVREAAKRALGERPYDVQLMGGIVLHQGKIAEMKTGEGKTLVATLPSYLNALAGKGVHVVTVNDYLAKRDAEWMGQVFAKLGLTTAAIYHGQTPEERRAAYMADITYATNSELGFDYLRDNMAYDQTQLVQRPLHYAIVDEVDSILVDEARTPLIISGPAEDKTEIYRAMNALIPDLVRGVDFEVDEKHKSATLTDMGMDNAETWLKQRAMLDGDATLYDIHNVMLVHHLNQALKAHALFTRDVDYILHNGEVMLIDEFTGRMMPGRRYSEGLHQAIEAKEGVQIKVENQTLASVTYQNYFRLYEKLAGMTGTAETEAEEFAAIYNLSVVVMPTNVPVARADGADIIYRSRAGKIRAMIADIKKCHEKGQPVLVGTTSIEKSEELSEHLKKEKIPHQVLNARYHEQEAEIVAQAGRKGSVTIATNMAGRGTDIKLGGNLELMLREAQTDAEKLQIRQQHAEEKRLVMESGGLRVIGTERHESRRIDNQLRGRSGRQGDVGSSQFYISLQDDLMRIFAKGLESLMARVNMPEDEAVQSRIISRAIETAQRKIEAYHFDVRKNLLKFDDVLNEQRKVIYDYRKGAMEADVVDDIISDFRTEALEGIFARHIPAESYSEDWNVSNLSEDVLRVFDSKPPLEEWLKADGLSALDMRQKLAEFLEQMWRAKEHKLSAQLMRRMEKLMLLQVLDGEWRGHLSRLDYLRNGIYLRGFSQRDPLNEFKREAFGLFNSMMETVRDETLAMITRIPTEQVDTAAMEREEKALADKIARESGILPSVAALAESKNIGRNDPCPCGSGKKYKHCHGAVVSRLAG